MTDATLPPQPPLQPPPEPQQSSAGSGLLEKIEALLNRLPTMPGNWSSFSKWIPWVNVVVLVLILPLVLAIVGLQFILLPFLAIGAAVEPSGFFNLIIYNGVLILAFAFQFFALPGLFKKTLRGWRLVFIGTLFNGLFNIINISIFGIIFTVFWLKVLTQVKSQYH